MPARQLPSIYHVELLSRQKTTISKEALLRSLRKQCPEIEPLAQDSDLLAFVHTDHPVAYRDGAIPAQTLIQPGDRKIKALEFEDAIQQSWRFPSARQRVAECNYSTLVTDLMSSGLDHRTRLKLFQAVLLGALDIVPCEAIHWVPTQQIFDPADYVEAVRNEELPQLFAGALNVRFFNIAGSDGEMVMDTLGLGALELVDLQCHFRQLDPNDVSRVLHNTASYVFQRGDIIEDGNAVAGIDAESKWRCQHEQSLIGPERIVLDLNPGAPYAAGNR